MKMKNAILWGIIIGVVSAIWIIIMHSNGIQPNNVGSQSNSWLEYTSVIIPFLGLHFGIKAYKKMNGGTLTFFEGIFEGFKIMAVGGLLAGAFSALYFGFLNQELTSDYMERIFGAVVLGLLFTLANTIWLMNTPKQL